MARGKVLGAVAVLVTVGAVAGGYVLVRGASGAPAVPPGQVALGYLTDWQVGDLAGMERFVREPPADFYSTHENLSAALDVKSVHISQGALVQDDADHAHEPFTITRTLGVGTWSLAGTLPLARTHGRWWVAWTPAVLYPGLRSGAVWALADVDGGGPTVGLDRHGKAIPADSTAQNYLPSLVAAGGSGGHDAAALDVTNPGRPTITIKVFGKATSPHARTTLDAATQAAADATVHASAKPAAVVVVQPSTGDVLAVADTLDTGRGAFLGLYSPGSTFKIVTAAALVGRGMSPSSAVRCPVAETVGQRTVRNDDGVNLGSTTLLQAFAQSCNTTFAQLATTRLTSAELTSAATMFGFNGHLSPGVQAYSGDALPLRTPTELTEAGFGESGRVQTTPLTMALVAAAVESGEWRPPRMLPPKSLPTADLGGRAHAIPGSVLAALRPMMRAVVTSGTGAAAGFPAGTYGKTGTAEYDDQGDSHAWFVGYRGDLAFAVFVEGGQSGPKVAAPLAAALLRRL